MTKYAFAAGFAVVAISSPGVSLAQGANAEVDAQGGEIVVTAQRREEKLRDVPISVTALSGKAIEQSGVSNGLSLGQITPGLNFQGNGSTIQPAIRGVTSTGSNPGDAANVAIYVDGVYQPVQFSNFLELVDIQSIEVLKGPQGTLFGRNATGGAITVATRKPSFNTTATVKLSYARYNEVNAQAFVSGGLSDKVAVSLAANYRTDDGFRRDLITNAKLAKTQIFSTRGKALFQISDDFSALFSADYTDSKDNTTFAGQPLAGNTATASSPGVVLATRPNTAALNLVPVLNVEGGGGSMRLEWAKSGVTVSSLTAYRHYTSLQQPDSDVSNIPLSLSRLDYKTDTWSQEFNLASAGDGPLSWIGGLFLFDDKQKLILQSFTGAASTRVLLNDVKTHTESAALFGEINYAVTDRLTLIGGLRYSIDRIDYVGANNGAVPVSPPAKTFRSLTPRASIRYELAPRTNVYFTYSKGYKAGVFGTSTPSPTIPPVNPEKIDAYEMGIKGDAGILSYSAAAYRYDYKDLQFQAFGATSLQSVLQNAATARINGAELNASITPFSGFSISGGLSYVDAKYSKFVGAQAFIPRAGGGNDSLKIDASGNRVIRTPEWSGNVGATLEVPIGDSKLRFSGNAFFSGTVYYDVSNRTRQKPYDVINASAAFVLPGDQLELEVFGTNLTDSKYFTSLLVSGLADNVNFARPATYGARLTYRY
ncbi:TonB-dependent receptor [Novosphingobium sp. G106]|uniref:TonB-dependent receptor n=1 Tax=Novosphingobium sp. G106 TaxID=2849500 RepID=UPI001C2D0585|nr:TonB-dependent receptor [Novosphingobium sp. G106]MBV1688941.1 TonB-dependent receptor [Novosphingobium sp. G106]